MHALTVVRANVSWRIAQEVGQPRHARDRLAYSGTLILGWPYYRRNSVCIIKCNTTLKCSLLTFAWRQNSPRFRKLFLTCSPSSFRSPDFHSRSHSGPKTSFYIDCWPNPATRWYPSRAAAGAFKLSNSLNAACGLSARSFSTRRRLAATSCGRNCSARAPIGRLGSVSPARCRFQHSSVSPARCRFQHSKIFCPVLPFHVWLCRLTPKIWTRFCCAVLYFRCITHFSRFMWFLYPYSSVLFRWWCGVYKVRNTSDIFITNINKKHFNFR